VATAAPDAYLRKILVNTRWSWWRSRWRQESPVASVPDIADPASGGGDPADRYALGALVRAALAALPRQQRAVLVLRYAEDLPEAAVAEILGCAVGTVKTHAHRGLRAVRAVLGDLDSFAQSFTFTASASRHPVDSQGSVTGEFDPVSGTGQEQVRSRGGQWQIRFVGGHAYSTTATFPDNLTHGKPWVETPWNQHVPGFPPRLRVTQFVADVPNNPADLLKLVKSATAVHVAGPASGSGWTDTKYSFTLTERDPNEIPEKASGTLSVDSAGRVRQLVISGSELAFVGPKAKKETLHFAQTQTFGGFGIPVRVTAPPASQVAKPKNTFLDVEPDQPPFLAYWVKP
jgi:Sigma-70, region 4